MSLETNTKSYLDDVYALAYPETQEFWAAAEEGRLLLKSCVDCGKIHWYPRMICPLCGSSKTSWSMASGKGEIYTYSVNVKAEKPYILAYVKLEEGPIILSNIINSTGKEVSIGQVVNVKFERVDGGRKMPFFEMR